MIHWLIAILGVTLAAITAHAWWAGRRRRRERDDLRHIVPPPPWWGQR